jgi:mutator protein MutT
MPNGRYTLVWISRGEALAKKDQDSILVVAAIFHRGQEVALFRRGPQQSGAGHWEFPGGKVEVGESETQALQREIEEELGIRIHPGEFLGENIHQYPAKKIRLRFYWVPFLGDPFVLSEHDAFQWVKPQDLDVQILSEADRPIVEKIKLDPRMT